MNQGAMGGTGEELERAFAEAITVARERRNTLYELRALNVPAGINPSPGVFADIRRRAASFDTGCGLPELTRASSLLAAAPPGDALGFPA